MRLRIVDLPESRDAEQTHEFGIFDRHINIAKNGKVGLAVPPAAPNESLRDTLERDAHHRRDPLRLALPDAT